MKGLLIILISFSFIGNCFSQDTTDTGPFIPQFRKGMMYVVKTSDGTSYVGRVTEESRLFITIEDRKTRLTSELRKSAIVSSRLFSDKKAHDLLLGENYHANYYMFSSSSVLYDKPEVSASYQWFLFENINIKIDENWDITTNTILLYPTTIGVKCAYEIGDEMYLGGNIFVVGNINANVLPYFFLGYGGLARFTKGNTNTNFSISGGVIGINNELFATPSSSKTKEPFLNLPFVNVAYANRFAERWSVVGEAFYFPEAQTGFAGGGFKFIKNEETSWTFGCFAYLNMVNNQLSIGRTALPIPFLSYTSNIFKRN